VSRLYCTVGWVDFGLFYIFNKSTPGFVIYLPKVPKKYRFIIGHDFLGHALYKGPKIFIPIWTSWVSKNAEFHADFKNINLP
jgi:hypothetical protein